MTESTPPLAARASTAITRVPLWDNARFVCVTLVVMGHGIQRMTYDSNNALIVYLFIYAFHMPAFAIISGYFSKADPPTVRSMRRVLTDIIAPYVIMETIWTVVQFLVEGKREFNPSTPSWTLWFLLALAIFRVVLPYLAIIRWPLALGVLLSVAVGYWGNVDSTFSLSRAIGILPFFILGWKAKQWGIVERWRVVEVQTWPIRITAIGVFLIWGAAVVLFIDTWRAIDLRFWFFYDDSYQGLGAPVWWAGLVRLALILLAVLLSAAFFVLVPRHDSWMTGFGQATMYIYLLHSFVLYPIRESGVLLDEHSSAMWLASMIFASIALSIALASPLVRRVFRPIIEPRVSWLLAKHDDRDARPSRRDPTGARRG